MSRKILTSHGVRGNRRILVVRDTERGRIFCERYVAGKPVRKPTFPLGRDGERLAKIYAERWYVSPAKDDIPQIALREMWEMFWEARCVTRPEDGGLRPRTKQLYRERWARFELHAKPETMADDVTLHTLDQFWNKMLKAGTAPNQIRHIITAVKVVYRWAESRELITRNRPHLYRSPGGAQLKAKEIPEFTPEEFASIEATCQPQDAKRWRFAVLWSFMGDHGFRSAATLSLAWDDVDLEAGTVTMIAANDKTHQRLTRPLTWDAYAALLTARHWRERMASSSPYVFFAGQKRRTLPWSYQAANLALQRHEGLAGVTHIKWRAFHGVRRMVATNVNDRTNNMATAMAWLGDDVRQATKYIKERVTEFREIADDRSRENA